MKHKVHHPPAPPSHQPHSRLLGRPARVKGWRHRCIPVRRLPVPSRPCKSGMAIPEIPLRAVPGHGRFASTRSRRPAQWIWSPSRNGGKSPATPTARQHPSPAGNLGTPRTPFTAGREDTDRQRTRPVQFGCPIQFNPWESPASNGAPTEASRVKAVSDK
jgi:hypothetical protein